MCRATNASPPSTNEASDGYGWYIDLTSLDKTATTFSPPPIPAIELTLMSQLVVHL